VLQFIFFLLDKLSSKSRGKHLVILIRHWRRRIS